jgi:hypothetical protein
MQQTAIRKAVEEIIGYKNFGKVLEIDFVVVLLEFLLEQEEYQIKQAYLDGREDEANSSGLFERTADQYYDTNFNPQNS